MTRTMTAVVDRRKLCERENMHVHSQLRATKAPSYQSPLPPEAMILAVPRGPLAVRVDVAISIGNKPTSYEHE